MLPNKGPLVPAGMIWVKGQRDMDMEVSTKKGSPFYTPKTLLVIGNPKRSLGLSNHFLPTVPYSPP